MLLKCETCRFVASNKFLIPATSFLQQVYVDRLHFRHRVAAAVGEKQQRVMCVRACAISFRLPSPRSLTGCIYINNKVVSGVAIGCFSSWWRRFLCDFWRIFFVPAFQLISLMFMLLTQFLKNFQRFL